MKGWRQGVGEGKKRRRKRRYVQTGGSADWDEEQKKEKKGEGMCAPVCVCMCGSEVIREEAAVIQIVDLCDFWGKKRVTTRVSQPTEQNNQHPFVVMLSMTNPLFFFFTYPILMAVLLKCFSTPSYIVDV